MLWCVHVSNNLYACTHSTPSCIDYIYVYMGKYRLMIVQKLLKIRLPDGESEVSTANVSLRGSCKNCKSCVCIRESNVRNTHFITMFKYTL